MKLKYYMRGVGTGILFTLFVFVVIIIPNMKLESRISEAGLDTEEKTDVSALVGKTDRDDESEATPPLTSTPEPTSMMTPTQAPTATPTQAPTATPTQAPTATPTQAPTATPTQAPTATPTQTPTATPTQAPTATPTPKPTTEPTPTVMVDDTTGTIKLTITKGMTSEKISKALEDYGVVDSWTELNSYISKNGYAAKIQVGTFTFAKDMSYRDVCKVICGKNFK